MADYFVKDTTLIAIADAIRSKTGSTDTISLSNMASAIESIQTGGGSGDEEPGLVVTSHHTAIKKAQGSQTATAVVDVPNNAIIKNVIGCKKTASNSKAAPLPDIVLESDPSYVTVTDVDSFKRYSSTATYGNSGYYNSIILQIIVTYKLPGLSLRADGNDNVLYADSTLISLPVSTTSYGEHTKVNLSAAPVNIPDYFEYMNAALKTALLNPGAAAIGQYAFHGCTSLTTVSDDPSAASGSVSLPGVTTIGSSSFYGCSRITEVSLPNATKIGQYSFYNCTSLKTVDIPSCTQLNRSTFEKCSMLESINFPSVTYVDGNAFYNCTKLTEVKFGPNVTCLEYSCFYGCRNLTSIDLSQCTSVPTCGGNLIGSSYVNANLQIKVPAALYDAWVADSEWSQYFSGKIVAV